MCWKERDRFGGFDFYLYSSRLFAVSQEVDTTLKMDGMISQKLVFDVKRTTNKSGV
jgi:hypothetical protein